ncbi:TetR/AcrR family transcriptional regulator [Brevibacillus centrosporus]|uniref:TetR/AcrR family transcriptional regulator n=1 Tax=Brevibacillus centrosporus TaxID=54910 RepID=UPI002E1DAC7C|nr:TetR/AcrR family transcriptional regulator [Brevibacillus centrosporus]
MRYEKFIPSQEGEMTDNPTFLAILNAASELFMQRGYKAVTMRDIAAHAGVNLGLIPYYFTSKENLANRVCMDMIDHLYQTINQIDMSGTTSAEKLFISSLLSWQYMDDHPDYARFFYEFYETSGAAETPSKSFIEMSQLVIHEYGIKVSPKENEIYFTVMKGAERLLILKRYNQQLHITLEEIEKVLISNYFYNIGLPDKVIAQIISNSQAFLKKHAK